MFNFLRISKIFQVYSFKKALNSLEKCVLGVFWMLCASINRHFDHVNEAAVQVYMWLNGVMPCTGDPEVESTKPD
jgi:hypothetical protein